MIKFIMDTISYLINKVLGNPVASTIILSLIEDLKAEGTDMLGIAVANIKSVAARDDITNTERFDIVVQALKKQFPNAASSLINTVVESAYRAFVNGKI